MTRDIPDNSVAVGNPARVIASFDAFCAKQRESLGKGRLYHQRPERMAEAEREEILKLLETTDVYCK